MYSLAPRFPKRVESSTPSNIAPNSYILCNGKGVFGGASVNYTALRLKYSDGDGPGPCHYDPKMLKEGCRYIPPPKHDKGRKYVCRVPYSIFPSAPSVPTHVDENGYDLDIYDNIIKVPADFHDISRGPAFYNVPLGETCFTTKRYHSGCEWSKSKTKRSSFPVTSTPGPGHYEFNYELCKCKDKDEEYRQMARLFTFIPRYTEAKMLQAAADDLPGPGQYNVSTSSFRCVKSLSINPRPFVVGASRFGPQTQSATPGPGDYEICDCPTAHRQFLTKEVPFGAKAARLAAKKLRPSPGPGSYNIKSALEEKMLCKANPYSTVEAPFLGKSRRKIGFVEDDAELYPGPGHYDIEDTTVEKQPINASFFKSRSKRFKTPKKAEEPGPGSHSVCESFNKNRNRKSHNAGKVPFLSNEPRSTHPKTKTPGPGDYEAQVAIGRGGASFGRTGRFGGFETDVPPPGNYTLPPSVTSSLYKGTATHNLRLKENVLRTKLRLHPDLTWQNWLTQLQKKKKLRWFAKPTADYRHCALAT